MKHRHARFRGEACGRLIHSALSQRPTQSLVMKKITLKGCLGGTITDTSAVYDLMASGSLRPLISTTTFDEIPAGLDRLERGEVIGRLVAVYPA